MTQRVENDEVALIEQLADYRYIGGVAGYKAQGGFGFVVCGERDFQLLCRGRSPAVGRLAETEVP